MTYYDNQVAKEIHNISNSVAIIADSLDGMIEAINNSTELKRKMLEMMQEKERINEMMKGINDDNK